MSTVLETLFLPFTLLFSLLPPKYHLQLILLKDSLLAVAYTVFGRLYPVLTVPPTDLRGKTAIVTGSNSGLGLQMASDLARQGCTVILACRNTSKAEAAANTILWRIPEAKGRVSVMQLDTSSLESVQKFAESWIARDEKRVDILVHNAGIATPQTVTVPVSKNGGEEKETVMEEKIVDLTDNGIDIIYATNVLGSFLLTHLLEPWLSETARVVFTSSTAQYGSKLANDFSPGPVRGIMEPGFHFPTSKVPLLGWERMNNDSVGRYSNSKTMQCAMARALQRKWDAEVKMNGKPRPGRMAHSFSPGFVDTPIFVKFEYGAWGTDVAFALLKLAIVLAITVEQGAATGSWLASTRDESVVGWGSGGGYWDRKMRRACNADLYSDGLLDRLWERWENDAGVRWR